MSQTAKKSKLLKRPGIRLSLALSVIMTLLVMLLLIFWLVTQSLFSGNRHFTVREIRVKSSGWWNGRGEDVARLLGIELGLSNLFGFELQELRRLVESDPGIQHASVRRILPDTLEIEILERIPRAFLYRRGSPWVLDGNGIVMASENCLELRNDLPVITGFAPDTPLEAGHEVPKLQAAIDLLHMINTKYHGIELEYINLQHPQDVQLHFRISAAKQPFTAYLPREKLASRMEIMNQALRKILKTRDPRRTIDLRFDGKVVLK